MTDAGHRNRATRWVSWCQPTPTVSIEMIHRLDAPTDNAILYGGGGASTLVGTLPIPGVNDLTVLDVLAEGYLGRLRPRWAPTLFRSSRGSL